MIGYMLTKRQAVLGHVNKVSQIFREVAASLVGFVAKTLFHVVGDVGFGLIGAFKRGGHGLPLIDGDKTTRNPSAQCAKRLPACGTSEGVVTRGEALVWVAGGKGGCDAGGVASQLKLQVPQQAIERQPHERLNFEHSYSKKPFERLGGAAGVAREAESRDDTSFEGDVRNDEAHDGASGRSIETDLPVARGDGESSVNKGVAFSRTISSRKDLISEISDCVLVPGVLLSGIGDIPAVEYSSDARGEQVATAVVAACGAFRSRPRLIQAVATLARHSAACCGGSQTHAVRLVSDTSILIMDLRSDMGQPLRHGLGSCWGSGCSGANLAQQVKQGVAQRPARLLCAAVHEVADRGLTAAHLFGNLWLSHFSVTLNFGNNVFPVHSRTITAFRLFGNVFSIPLFRKL